MRTGVALSDSQNLIARPLDIVASEELEGFLARLVRDEDVSEVVVGVPRTLSGEVGFQARKVLDKLSALRRALPGVRFVEWDERFTTRLVSAGARSGGRKKGRARKDAGRVDHLAAARMLQEYLGMRGDT